MSIKTNALIYFLAFCSGFCIMGIELLGGRILAPYFGSSVHIWGSIITVFMLSLSLGYLLGGKLSTKNASLTKYGLIFLVASIMVVPIALFSQPIMEFIFTHIEAYAGNFLLASTALFLFLPSYFRHDLALLSVRLLVTDSHKSGQVAGVLYFVSTLGSALGTIITSFYFVLAFDVNTIISAFASTLGLLGVLAITVNSLGGNKELAHA
ncbi:fused MFS/spermidine synthase (plasmid) [Pseudoalteromonas espejiana]